MKYESVKKQCEISRDILRDFKDNSETVLE